MGISHRLVVALVRASAMSCTRRLGTFNPACRGSVSASNSNQIAIHTPSFWTRDAQKNWSPNQGLMRVGIPAACVRQHIGNLQSNTRYLSNSRPWCPHRRDAWRRLFGGRASCGDGRGHGCGQLERKAALTHGAPCRADSTGEGSRPQAHCLCSFLRTSPWK